MSSDFVKLSVLHVLQLSAAAIVANILIHMEKLPQPYCEALGWAILTGVILWRGLRLWTRLVQDLR